MHWIDWSIIGAYVLVVTLIGFVFIKRASGSVAEYFVAGRNLPWWLAGTSLVATAFAADTPLFVTGVIASKGIAGNWLWWNQAIAWSLAMVFFARLWRRTGLMTDAEFIELRYSGRSGAFLRGFRALYMSLIFSTCTLAWVMLAMQKIVSATLARPAWVDAVQSSLEGALGLSPGSVDVWKWIVLVALFGVAALYTVLSGFWGIVVTDLVQFVVAMVGAFLFAGYAVDAVGGLSALKLKVLEAFGPERTSNLFSFFPEAHSPWMPISLFAVYLGIYWWTDCGQFAAQRMFSTRTERDSVLTAVWFSIANFVLRPWPWIITAFVALLYFPGAADAEATYPKLMMAILPVGIRGLLVASLLAAFMSTVDTHLNWNASYFVADIYRRFIAPGASEARCVTVSRWAVLGYAALAIVVAYFMTSIESAVVVLFNLQAGIGLVLILRWFWWRINAWSEISAMIASVVVNTALPFLNARYEWGLSLPERVVITVCVCAFGWVTVTLLTQPVSAAQLDAFFRKVRPATLFWGPVARRCPEVTPERGLRTVLCGWLGSAVALYAVMIAVGKAVLLEFGQAALAFAICAAATAIVWACYRKKSSPFIA